MVQKGVTVERRGQKDRRRERTRHKKKKRGEKSRVGPCVSISLLLQNGEIFGNASLGQGSRNEWMLNRDGRIAFLMGFEMDFLLNAEVATAVQIKVKPKKWNGTKTLKRKKKNLNRNLNFQR